MWIWIWLAVLVASIVIEFLTMEMLSCWFIIGSLAALILAACGVPVYIQVIVAIALSLVFLLCFRRLTLKLLNRDNTETNVNALIGKTAKLTTPITDDVNGSLKVNDVVWTAKAMCGEEIEAGQKVVIKEVKGNTLYVKKEI